MELFVGAFVTAITFVILLGLIFEKHRSSSGLLWTFMALFFPLWALAVWLPPAGPIVYDIAWLQLLLVGFILALFVMATTPAAYKADSHIIEKHKEIWARGANAFFLIFTLMTIMLIAAGYYGIHHAIMTH